MNREEAVTVAENLLERRTALKRQLEAVDVELKKLSKNFGLIINMDGGVVT